MPEIKRRAHNFRNIISSLSNLYGNMKGIELRFIIPKDMPEVYIDAEQIKRVFINLFDNAIEAMRKEGIITVSVDIDKELSILNISVSDTGPGIDDADKEKLFAPYFSKKKNGSGLGLAIAERIVAEHGGSITVSDKTPNGSIFSISLPLLPQ
jgi:two-component system nitrogen regulation sensor histidine kinase NtrY